MIDAHIHLHQYNDIENKIEHWKEGGIKKVVAVSNDLHSSYETLELQMRHPDFVIACIGFHPELPLPAHPDFHEWKTLLRHEHNRIAAIGEIGLPHYHSNQLPGSLDQYIEMFTRFLDVARIWDLPVAIHAVHDKAEIAFTLLQEFGITNAHFHWLKAPEHIVNQIINAGYYISVTPEVCYRDRDRQLAKKIPLNQLLIETDGPWQFDGVFQKQQTSPLLLPSVIQTLADIKNFSYAEIEKQTRINTRLCYQLTDGNNRKK